jgi:hypothetical protein
VVCFTEALLKGFEVLILRGGFTLEMVRDLSGKRRLA